MASVVAIDPYVKNRWNDLRYSLQRTVAPTVEPVTVANLKVHARIGEEVTDEDVLLASYITAAREIVELDTEMAFINQTWQLKFDAFPTDYIELRVCPVSSVTSVVYLDTAGVSTTWATSNYIVNTASWPGRISLAYSKTWPIALSQENSITVTFVAGYGAAATSVPERAKQAIRMLAAEWAISREAVGTMSDELLTNYRAVIARLGWGAYR